MLGDGAGKETGTGTLGPFGLTVVLDAGAFVPGPLANWLDAAGWLVGFAGCDAPPAAGCVDGALELVGKFLSTQLFKTLSVKGGNPVD